MALATGGIGLASILLTALLVLNSPDPFSRVAAGLAELLALLLLPMLGLRLYRRETAFRTLVENSPDAVIRYDLQCRRIYCNPAQTSITGVPNTELLGKTADERSPFPVEVAAAYAALVRQAIEHAQAAETELNWERQGVPACLHLRLVPELDGEGRVVGALAVARDISRIKQTEATLRQSRDLLRALAAHRESKHETERQQLAYQIHEDLAQNLSALRMNIALIEINSESAASAQLARTMRDTVDHSIARVRDMVAMLRPAVLNHGLAPALHWLTDDFKSVGFGFEFDLALQEDVVLNDRACTFLFRVAQEALINVALHAMATHVRLSLSTHAGVCRLLVRDNGRGFDPSAPRGGNSFGLIGLAEQARYLGGDFSVDSSPGRGTVVQVGVPADT